MVLSHVSSVSDLSQTANLLFHAQCVGIQYVQSVNEKCFAFHYFLWFAMVVAVVWHWHLTAPMFHAETCWVFMCRVCMFSVQRREGCLLWYLPLTGCGSCSLSEGTKVPFLIYVTYFYVVKQKPWVHISWCCTFTLCFSIQYICIHSRTYACVFMYVHVHACLCSHVCQQCTACWQTSAVQGGLQEAWQICDRVCLRREASMLIHCYTS